MDIAIVRCAPPAKFSWLAVARDFGRGFVSRLGYIDPSDIFVVRIEKVIVERTKNFDENIVLICVGRVMVIV